MFHVERRTQAPDTPTWLPIGWGRLWVWLPPPVVMRVSRGTKGRMGRGVQCLNGVYGRPVCAPVCPRWRWRRRP